ncbi:hypothetical protein EV13_1686 [Prochlorococcus sp. MIT 0702]|nr:hypothetical protein EV12_2116 [Prochlorococcus sp. MIT 0701]KGG28059.1 hypothetical protein EV13_1686 [Prochlorococcus sp. MIT 0702]KGG34208.1 hypothetical protein EV14_1444 [Prochlorococcus sp. MIT 0703]
MDSRVRCQEPAIGPPGELGSSNISYALLLNDKQKETALAI